jgi:hypothetical protein
MRNRSQIKNAFVFALSLMFGLQGCSGRSTLDEIEKSFSANSKGETSIPGGTYVEAVVEYTSPGKKWAAFPTTSIHLKSQSKDGFIEVNVTPKQTQQVFAAMNAKANPEGRKIASETNTPSKMGVEELRSRLSILANEMGSSDQSKYSNSYTSCMAPIKVRLLRADGSVFEKMGCRSGSGWSSVASHLVNDSLKSKY